MPVSQTASLSKPIRDSASARPKSNRLQMAGVVFLLLLFSEALLGRLFASEQNPEGGAFLRIMWVPIYGFTLVQLALHWRLLFQIALRSPGTTLLSLLAIASALWSLDPSTSFRRGIAVFCTTAFGYYLASAFSWRDLLRCLGITWLILAVGNLIAGAVFPDFGVMYEIHVGAWKGLWFEKNNMGGHFARTAFLFAFLIFMDREWRKWWAGGLLMSLALVLLSTSKTSLLGLLLGLAILGGYLWMRQNRVLAVATMWVVFSTGLAAIIALLTIPETIASIIGRDLTLTGRTDIWAVLFGIIEERPMFGYGYGAFWAPESPPAQLVRATTEWEVPTAHNGLLEVMLALGQFGAAMFVLDYMIGIGRALFTMHRRATSVFAFGFLIVFALFSISESVILIQNNITWVMYCALLGKLALETRSEVSLPEISRQIRLPHRTRLRGRSRG